MSDPGDDEDFRPRENDHLVEPMFAGLGVDGDEPAPEGDEVSAQNGRSLLARVLAWLRAAVGLRPPSGGAEG